jgi:tetratricopeptide (TPR) repeat protein
LELLRAYRADPSVPRAARAHGAAELAQVAEKTQGASALVGEARMAAGDTTGALKAFRRALEASPKDPYILRRLCDLETGDTRIHDLEVFFDLNRNDASIGLDLMTALFAAKRNEDAVRVAKTLESRFLENSLVLIEAARLLHSNGQAAEAVNLEERALRLDPDNLEARIAYADDLRAVGRTQEATGAYFQLVAKDPSANSYRQLITLLSRRDLPDDLSRAYREALAKRPDDFELRRDYARWLATRSPDAALAEWKVILDKSKNAFLREFAQREMKRIEDQRLLDR